LALNFDKVANIGETNTIVKDVSSYGSIGTIYGSVPWTINGKRGGAYDFSPSNNYISIPDSPRFTLASNYTVAAWINPDNIANRTKAIMGTYNGTNGFIFALDNISTNRLAFR